MGSILDFPLALFSGSMIGVHQSSLAIGSADLAGIFVDVTEGAFGSFYSGS